MTTILCWSESSLSPNYLSFVLCNFSTDPISTFFTPPPVFHFIPYLRLRCDEDSEIVGIDDAELGEFTFDYIALDPELRLHRDEDSKLVTDSNADYNDEYSTRKVVQSDELPAQATVEAVDEAEHHHNLAGTEKAPGGGRVDV